MPSEAEEACSRSITHAWVGGPRKQIFALPAQSVSDSTEGGYKVEERSTEAGLDSSDHMSIQGIHEQVTCIRFGVKISKASR